MNNLRSLREIASGCPELEQFEDETSGCYDFSDFINDLEATPSLNGAFDFALDNDIFSDEQVVGENMPISKEELEAEESSLCDMEVETPPNNPAPSTSEESQEPTPSFSSVKIEEVKVLDKTPNQARNFTDGENVELKFQIDVRLVKDPLSPSTNEVSEKLEESSVSPSTSHQSHEVTTEDLEEEKEDGLFSSYILRRLTRDYWERRKLMKTIVKKGRGRPEMDADDDMETLEELFVNHLNEVEKKTSKNKQRSDAKTATIARKVKKIPDVFLKHIGSKCKFKSKNIYEVAECYAKTYVLAYKKFFFVPELDPKEEFNHFLCFICLVFPESKVKAILALGNLEPAFVSKASMTKFMGMLKIRKNASKKSFQELLRSNTSFKVIASKILENVDKIKENSDGSIKKTLEGLFEIA